MIQAYFDIAVWMTAGVTALTMFTAPCPPPGTIQRVIYKDDLVYARAMIPTAYEPILDSYSEDGGQTWQFLNNVPAGVAKELEQQVILPKVVCDPANPQPCYRIAGQGQVEESMDGGATWRIAWSLPEERRSYMERVAHCRRPIEAGPNDLVLINQDGMHILIVAIGNEGVLVHTSSGDWERYTVVPGYGIGPTPYAAETFWTATWILPVEIAIWMLAALLTLIYLWRRTMNMMSGPMKASICILTTIGIFPLAWLPFPLWALGIISLYEFALGIAILLTALIWWWGIRRAHEASQRVST